MRSMRLKKCSAVAALISVVLFTVHIVYEIYASITFYYDPSLTKLLSILLIAPVCVHAVLGMSIVFLMSDGTDLTQYPRQNLRTILQRISAALFFPLLFLHVRTFEMLRSCAQSGQWAGFWMLIIAEVLFFADILTHSAVSLTRALITMGWLSSRETQEKIDRAVYIIGFLLFMAASVTVIRMQIIIILFSH